MPQPPPPRRSANSGSLSALTQEQLAHELHVGWATVQRWESGKAIPREIARVQLARLAAQTTKIDWREYM